MGACEGKPATGGDGFGPAKAWGPEYKFNVMILCNLNSSRAQMADAWLRQLRGSASVGVASAGMAGTITPDKGAVEVMKEVGIDIAPFASKAMADFSPEAFDVVISCSGSGGKLEDQGGLWTKRAMFLDWNLDDPPNVDPGDLSVYRRIRDECKTKVQELLDVLRKPYGPQYKHNVMFLCNNNSCQSQMADAWLRELGAGTRLGVASAGIEGGAAVKDGAITVMKEAGVDISSLMPASMTDFKPEDFDAVICCGDGSKLVGEKADWKKRPIFSEWKLDDPPATGDLSSYRKFRDESKAKVEELLDVLSKPYGPQYKYNVMFLCNHNSCRSQMADGWMRSLRGKNSIGVASAGIVGGTAVKEGAIKVMGESGIDISNFTSDAMADFKPEMFQAVISCCGCGGKLDNEKEVWKRQGYFSDWNLDDPPAIDPGDFSSYRRVRDESRAKVLELIGYLAAKA
mmetsp:Transcript_22089/g.41647  ORF Transcript_22089/g.41647 Transcript_22089/m.41647 type:complete len:457 (-) Transcript_22089:79-1449(-)